MPGPKKGYSLLELLVVLALIGMLTAIVVPALNATYSAWQWKNIQQDVIRQIQGLSTTAFKTNTEFRFSDGNAYIKNLPVGVSVRFDPELVINPQGVCYGAELTIAFENRKQSFYMKAPYCEVGG